eukprot:411788_1
MRIPREGNTDHVPNTDHGGRAFYFLITIAICVFLALVERVYDLETAIVRSDQRNSATLSNYRSYLNMCSNQAILFDDTKMYDVVRERNKHLINLGISLDIIEMYGRPYTVDGSGRFFTCRNCRITMWTVKKLIKLCEKKYHTDLYKRYNPNKTITEKVQKEYNQRFDQCQKAKQYLQSETSLGTS